MIMGELWSFLFPKDFELTPKSLNKSSLRLKKITFCFRREIIHHFVSNEIFIIKMRFSRIEQYVETLERTVNFGQIV